MGSKLPLVSVIVPAYNAEQYIEECIESVINQSYRNIEIIIVDDTSNDKTLKIAQKYRDRDKRVIVAESRNRNAALTRRDGVLISTGEYVCFVDSDDYVAENYVEELYNTLAESAADISSVQVISSGSTLRKDEYSKRNLMLETDTLKYFVNHYHAESAQRYISQSMVGKMYPRVILHDLDFSAVKTTVLEDNIIMAQILKRVSGGVSMLNQSLYTYRNNEASTMNSVFKQKIKYGDEMLDYPEVFERVASYVKQVFSSHDDVNFYIEKLRADEYYQLSRRLGSLYGQIEWMEKDLKDLQSELAEGKGVINHQAAKLLAIESSYTFKVGRIVLKPFRVIKKILALARN